MKIRSMHLEHYRCFEDFDIDFENRLTVLVGANGAGKTAILDALSIFLRWAGHPYKRNSPGYQCEMSVADFPIGDKAEYLEYRLKVQPPCDENDIKQLHFVFNKHNQIPFILCSQASSAFVHVKEALDTKNPLFVSYMAGRFINEKNTRLQDDFLNPFYTAFENAFERTIDYTATLSWFDNMDADEARAMRDSGQKNELPELKAVREALSKALLGQYERPRMSGSPSELIVYGKGTDRAYKVSQLSDGYRAMLALVMDLARRMAQARGSNHQPGEPLLNYPAIVLIDEVELHLHPAWQQTVLTTLMGIFTNTQFIVTTHSPQVLTSILPKHIRILRNGKAYTVNAQTQGTEASRALKHVFGVDLRPNLEIVQALYDYEKLVYDELWDTPKAKELRKKLDEHYGNDEPKLVQLDLHIDNTKWERSL